MNNLITQPTEIRAFIQRIFFICVILILLNGYHAHILLHQLREPALIYAYIDLTYWIIILLGIPQFLISHSYIAATFDAILLLTALFSLIWPRSNKFPIIFGLFYFVNFLCFNLFAAHHYHSVGILFLSVPFMFKDTLSFNFAFRGIRYIFLFEMVSASLWKIGRGTVFNLEQFSSIQRSQSIEYLTFFPDTWRANINYLLIGNNYIAHTFWILLIISQFSFIIGFFTLKYDILLLIIYASFAILAFTLMNIVSFETSIYIITLIPWNNLPFIKKEKNIPQYFSA